MKLLKSVSLLILLSFYISANAQQDPYYSHSNWNKQSFNPAVAGEKDDYTCVTLVGHKQWFGYQDQTFVNRETGENIEAISGVAPQTFNVVATTQLRSINRTFGGIGISMTDDRLGYTKSSSIRMQGAFFIPMQRSQRLSIGVDMGLQSFGFNNPSFRARQLNDPRIPTGSITDTKPDVGIGVYYLSPNGFGAIRNVKIGGSVTHLNASTHSLVGKDFSLRYDLVPHYYFHSEVSYRVPNGLTKITPFLLLKYNSELQADFNVIGERNSRFSYGLGYRQGGNSDALTIFLGIRENNVQVGYSFDKTISSIRNVSSGTHEIAVRWCIAGICPKGYFKTPREL